MALAAGLDRRMAYGRFLVENGRVYIVHQKV
jgi:hypothetical protein